jgi:hypothetical protein
MRGSSLVLFLEYSNGCIVVSEILSNMFEINVYSIIDSNVFGVTIGDNFLFSIRVKRFYNYKHEVEEQRMQLRSTRANNTN